MGNTTGTKTAAPKPMAKPVPSPTLVLMIGSFIFSSRPKDLNNELSGKPVARASTLDLKLKQNFSRPPFSW
jgi:hypothetical protein